MVCLFGLVLSALSAVCLCSAGIGRDQRRVPLAVLSLKNPFIAGRIEFILCI